jgi:hypothetical protein
MAAERVDVTDKVTIKTTTGSGWLLDVNGQTMWLPRAMGYFDDIEKTMHVDRGLAEQWKLV